MDLDVDTKCTTGDLHAAGASGWRAHLKQFYETRGAAYRDGVKEFIRGYKLGVSETASAGPADEPEGVELPEFHKRNSSSGPGKSSTMKSTPEVMVSGQRENT